MKTPGIRSMEQLLSQFVEYAERQEDIRGVIVMGSYARVDHPADKWSDLDLLVITSQPDKYLDGTEWVGQVARPLLSFEKQATGEGWERRVLFEGGLDVDFSIEPLTQWMKPGFSEEWVEIVRRGVRVVVNKGGIVQLPTISRERPSVSPPTQAQFLELINDFLYHALWTAKKLRRPELWSAKSCCDSYMKRLLFRAIELEARATRGLDYDTWHAGRFVEEWADPKVVERLRDSFAQYDEKDVRRALKATLDLFREVTQETAAKLDYDYPYEEDRKISRLVDETLNA